MKIFDNLFKGIKGRVVICFFSIIVLFCIYGGISNYLISKNQDATNKINRVYQPVISSLTDLELLMNELGSLTANWIKIDIEQHPDKLKLKEVHSKTYPELKSNILSLQEELGNKNISDSLKVIFVSLDKNLAMQKEIMESLAKFDNYQDMLVKIDAESKSDIVISDLKENIKKLHVIQADLKNFTSAKQIEMIKDMSFLSRTNIFLLLLIIAAGLFLTLRLSNHITRPIHTLKTLIDKVSKGELDNLKVKTSNDEIGEMMESVHTMIDGLKVTASFASEIGNGNLETNYKSNGEKDVLGNALISMRDNLLKVSKEDKQRNWANEGYASFGEILRNQNESMDKILDHFLSKLVKYIHANQGWLYVVNSHSEDEPYLELVSVYAFDRKKHVNKKILKGEGLTGQCWVEGDIIYITEVPNSYVEITSGLGDANPRCILIVPLKVNDQVNGVIEFASFHVFQPFEIEFVKRLSENLSSALSSIEINNRTKILLEESQNQKRQMNQQEEELRQNLEELQATQEEMMRKQSVSDKQLVELKETEQQLRKENQDLIEEISALRQKVSAAEIKSKA